MENEGYIYIDNYKEHFINISDFIDEAKNSFDYNVKKVVTEYHRGSEYNNLCKSLKISTKGLSKKDKENAIHTFIQNETDEKKKEKILNEFEQVKNASEKSLNTANENSIKLAEQYRKKTQFFTEVVLKGIRDDKNRIKETIEKINKEISEANKNKSLQSKDKQKLLEFKIEALNNEKKDLEEKYTASIVQLKDFMKKIRVLNKNRGIFMEFCHENGLNGFSKNEYNEYYSKKSKTSSVIKDKNSTSKDGQNGKEKDKNDTSKDEQNGKEKDKNDTSKDGQNGKEKDKNDTSKDGQNGKDKNGTSKDGQNSKDGQDTKSKNNENGNTKNDNSQQSNNYLPISIDLNESDQKIVEKYVKMSIEERQEVMKNGELFAAITSALANRKVCLVPGRVDLLESNIEYDSNVLCRSIKSKDKSGDIYFSIENIFNAAGVNFDENLYSKMYDTKLKSKIKGKIISGELGNKPNLIYSLKSLKADQISTLTTVIKEFYYGVESGRIKDEKLIEEFKTYIDNPLKQGIINSYCNGYFKKLDFKGYLDNLFSGKQRKLLGLRTFYSEAGSLVPMVKSEFKDALNSKVESPEEIGRSDIDRKRQNPTVDKFEFEKDILPGDTTKRI